MRFIDTLMYMQHQEGNFKGYKDFNIYYQKWLPGEKARAALGQRFRE
jgi:hypothetical protein